ncbi:hypothetical protein [Proteiniborus sp. MB09-C3]|uniref:hypothetical protein n=1 Tax=Proteiniborus sp. MB09-C3 TaxID=3050072 RepID=UPI002552AC51|nr:hypothetical protein [Proteiniborus sp. MB09-C3]WIV11928.1 hypothetical protein QO263_17805 [Proteiniborus sp. MB09-C3]
MDLALEKKVFYNNVKIVSFNIVALALVYIGAIYLMIDKSDLSENTMAFIGEQLLSPIGIILFVRIALIEHDYGVSEITYSKIYSYWRIILYRIIIASIQLFLLLSIAFITLKLSGGDFNVINILFGSFVTSFYLGVIGMILGYMTEEISVGVLMPFIYYFFEMFSKGKITKSFYLFGMLEGNYIGKIALFSMAITLVLLFLSTIKKEA